MSEPAATPNRYDEREKAGNGRIRRTADFPRFAAHELALRARYPVRAEIAHAGVNLTVRWRRSRWWRLSEDPETYTRSRTTFAWFVRAGKKIGAVRFNEIDAGMEEDNVFLLSMDDNSFSDGQLALTLCSEWRDVGFTVGCYGPIVEVAEAWIHPHFAPGGSWADVATMLLARLFADRSILVLKAFPLEYEGTTPAGSPSPTALLSRQRAMVRHYRRTLNARSLPGRPGKEGWMWLANPRCRDVLPRPKYNPRLKM